MSKHLLDKFEIKIKEGGSSEGNYDERLLEQFYKRDENVVLFQIFEIICAGGEEMLYSEICKKYNERHASTKKRCA